MFFRWIYETIPVDNDSQNIEFIQNGDSMKQILLLMILSVSIYAQIVPKLTQPVQITDYSYFSDGGSIDIELTDKAGQKMTCFFDILGTLSCNGVEIKFGSSEETVILQWVKSALNNKARPPRAPHYGVGGGLRHQEKEPKILNQFCLKQIEEGISNYEKCRTRAIEKRGKSELLFRDPKGHFTFVYPVTWNADSDVIAFVPEKSHGCGASMHLSSAIWSGNDPIAWYRHRLSHSKKEILFAVAELPYSVAGVKAFRIWDGPDGTDKEWTKTNCFTIVFFKNGRAFSIFTLNQFLDYSSFHADLKKVLTSFTVLK